MKKKNNEIKRFAIAIMLFCLGMNNYIFFGIVFGWYGLFITIPLAYFVGKTTGDLI